MHAKRALLKYVKSPVIPGRDLLTRCGACFKGQYQARVPADTACTYCVAGKYSENHSAHLCLDCPAGKSSDWGATSCSQCGPGYYNGVAGGGCLVISPSPLPPLSLSRARSLSLARSSRARSLTFSAACAGVSERGVWDGGDGLLAVRGWHEGAGRGQLDQLRGVRGGEVPAHG